MVSLKKKHPDKALLVFKVEEVDRAAEHLKSKGLNLVSKDDIS